MTLRIKLLLLIGLLVISILIINTALYDHSIKKELKEQKRQDISRIATLLQKDIEITMLSGRPDFINSIIENYSRWYTLP